MLSHEIVHVGDHCFVSAVQQSLHAAGLLYKLNTVARRAAKWSLPSNSNKNICLPTVRTIPDNHSGTALGDTTPPLLHLLI